MSKALNRFLNCNNILVFILVLSDVLSLVLAFLLAYFLRDKGIFRIFLDVIQPISVYLQALPIAVLTLLVAFSLGGLYEPKQRKTQISEMYNVLRAVTLWLLLIMASSYLYKFDYSRITVILTYFFAAVLIIFGRLLVRSMQYNFLKKGYSRTNVLIIGAGRLGREIETRLKLYAPLYSVVGFIDNSASKDLRMLGRLEDLNIIIKKHRIQEVYIANLSLSRETILDLVARSSSPTKFKVVSNIFDLVTGSIDIANLERIPSLDVNRIHFPLWKRVYKRTFDVLFSTISLIFTFPLWLVILAAIKLDSLGPGVITQVRIGENGKTFKMYKFRTMKYDTSLYNKAPVAKNDARITKVGKLLRRFSLDELPQFINILRGEMSVVGPRPEMPFIVKKYTYWEKKRLEIKPGLTGLWQILGRKDLPLHENLEYDFYYINNQSFALDIVIIVKTIPIVMKGTGAY